MISNKCFIHSPAKEKAKTSIIELWPYQLIRWLYLGAGLLIKRWCAKPRCWHEMCYMGKVSTFFFIIISKANVSYLFQKIKKKFSYSEKKYQKNDKLKRIWNLNPKAFEKNKANATAKRFRTSWNITNYLNLQICRCNRDFSILQI